MLSLSVEGETALAARFAAMPAAIRSALNAKAILLAQALKDHVVQDKLAGQILQSRTGALRASIDAEVSVDGDQTQVRLFAGEAVKYAAIQEFGGRTPAHDIAPDKAKALAFTVGGRRVFARIVHHPGSTIPARPYLSSALADMGPQIAAELKAAAVAALGS